MTSTGIGCRLSKDMANFHTLIQGVPKKDNDKTFNSNLLITLINCSLISLDSVDPVVWWPGGGGGGGGAVAPQ